MYASDDETVPTEKIEGNIELKRLPSNLPHVSNSETILLVSQGSRYSSRFDESTPCSAEALLMPEVTDATFQRPRSAARGLKVETPKPCYQYVK